jgi:selenocysteine-specific elongation factor
MSHPPLTLGTAGHIDHGKTALIAALTGVDTDRLPEERERGISIELGYASLTLPSGRRLSVIDVPGHERFVRTMVAGATGIDLYLMTIAADDGVMPQTREHAAVLQALAVERGVVAVTKSDLLDPEIAMIEASELLPTAEVVAVCARTGQGLDELRDALDRAAAFVASRAEESGPARLHIDRAFTIRGAGTVVTGTLWSGEIGRGDELAVLPAQRRVRVRGVQVHDQPLEKAAAGQRVALNLTGVAVDEVGRGDVVVSAGSEARPGFLIDAELTFTGRQPEHGDRVQVHHGTREAAARLAWLGGRFWQIRLEQPLVVAAGDRLVVRQIAPPDTIGGGIVLDPHPRKHGPSRALLTRLERLSRGESTPEIEPPQPQDPAPAPAPQPLSASALELERRLREAGFEPPLESDMDPDELTALRAAGRATRVSRTLHYHPEVLDEVKRRVIALAGEHGGAITLAQLRDALGTSRKFAQALLEHLDAERVTLRRGDEHVLRRGTLADQSAPPAAGGAVGSGASRPPCSRAR